jgi:hypothetical protein
MGPAHANDLPAHRRQPGFDNRDFDFNQFDRYSGSLDGKCVATVKADYGQTTR